MLAGSRVGFGGQAVSKSISIRYPGRVFWFPAGYLVPGRVFGSRQGFLVPGRVFWFSAGFLVPGRDFQNPIISKQTQSEK